MANKVDGQDHLSVQGNLIVVTRALRLSYLPVEKIKYFQVDIALPLSVVTVDFDDSSSFRLNVKADEFQEAYRNAYLNSTVGG